MALQGIGLAIYCPCHLSYYNLLVGGLPGAEKLGFEVTYWGDTVREPILVEAAQLSHGKLILFAPNLAPFQVAGVEMCSPALRDADVRLIGWNPSKPTGGRPVRVCGHLSSPGRLGGCRRTSVAGQSRRGI